MTLSTSKMKASQRQGLLKQRRSGDPLTKMLLLVLSSAWTTSPHSCSEAFVPSTTTTTTHSFFQNSWNDKVSRQSMLPQRKSRMPSSTWLPRYERHTKSALRYGGEMLPLSNRGNQQARSTAPLSDLIQDMQEFSLAHTVEDEIELHEGQRLVCMGDVHGDLEGLQSFLEIAGVYDRREDQWIGGDTILVQCGDVLDRGSEELACFSLLASLSRQALHEGGKLICLYGNHEAMNAMGLFQYATHDWEYEDVLGTVLDETLHSGAWRMQYVNNQPARWATYEPGGLLARNLLANFKVAVKVGNTVCVHAGLTVEHLEEYGGISGMNTQAREWITNPNLANVTYNNDGDYPSLQQPWVEAEARQTSYIKSAPPFLSGGIGDPSPIWMRDYSHPSDANPKSKDAQKKIDKALTNIHADRMVMGHTVQKRINCALDGKAWRVDVGVSRGVMGGTPEVLEVMKQNGEEVVSVLTRDARIPAGERQIQQFAFMF